MTVRALLVGVVFSLGSFAEAPGPCEDFFQYTCGAWIAANPIPKAEAVWGVTNELRERNTATLHEILETARTPSAERSTVRREIGDFYESCMDTGGIEQRGTEGLKEDLSQIAGIRSAQSLLQAITNLHAKAVNPFWILSAQPDPDHSTMMLADIGQGGFSLPGRAYYVRQDKRSVDLRAKLQEHIKAMFIMLGDEPEQAATQAAAILKLETQMAQAALERQDQIDPKKTTHRFTFEQLQKLMPHVDWTRYMEAMHVAGVSELNVRSPEYLKGIDHLLASSNEKAMKAYLRWRVLASVAGQLPEKFGDLNFKFYGTTLSGIEERKPRWWRCTTETDNELGEALGQEFVVRAFGQAAKERITALVHELEISLKEDLHELSWMGDATRAQALRKMSQLTRKFGYPDHWIDYSSVKLSRDDYLGNVQRLDAFLIARDLTKIGKPVDPAEWDMTPPTVNASYEPPANSINFPAGILQPPMFSNEASDAENLGAIGVVIGHELTHGYDNHGRRYDADGNLRDWWTPEDDKAFEERAQCMVKEYGTFDYAPGMKGNGQLTLGENIADNGGMRIAYRTLQRLLAKTPGASEQRDAQGLTPGQRFFVAFGGSWCQHMRDETARNLVLTNEHSPARWRVNGTVQNMPEFQKVFGCLAGQPMVRAPACRVW